jgi:small nuclear ribonucleoprotein D1
MKAVKLIVRNKDPLRLDTISLRGNTIRYIILPDTLNLDSLLIEEMPKKVRAKEGLFYIFPCLI